MDFSQLPLRDMHTPEAIGWWPLAAGWWVLLGMLIIVIILLLLLMIKKNRQPKQVALTELKRIEQRYSAHQNHQKLLVECNILMKRLALTLYPRSRVADLSGHNWSSFLHQTSKTIDASCFEIFTDGPYQPSVNFNSEKLIENCRLWIKQVKGVSGV